MYAIGERCSGKGIDRCASTDSTTSHSPVLDGNTANKQAMAVNMTTNPPSSMGVFDIPGEADIKLFYQGDKVSPPRESMTSLLTWNPPRKTYWTDTNAWDGIVVSAEPAGGREDEG